MVVYAEVSNVAQGPPFIYACAGINKKTWLLNITDIFVFKLLKLLGAVMQVLRWAMLPVGLITYLGYKTLAGNVLILNWTFVK